MRKRNPAASSGPACHRCTAVLFAGIPRCGMCGWPAGVGYPPAEGELELVSAPEAAAEPEASVDEPDHVGAQLDALSGMIERQGQALSPVQVDVDDASVEQEAPETQAPAAPPEPVDSADGTPTPTEGDAAGEEIDPLTAPLSAITGAATMASEPTGQPVGVHVESDQRAELDAEPEPISEDASDDITAIDDAESAASDIAAEPVSPVGRAAGVLRPAQLLIVATATLNLILVGFDAAFGATAGAMTSLALGLALITLALWTGSAVTFLHWVSRAHAHVAATATRPQRHGSSMSLLGWFIPIAGFVIGYRVLQDLWTGSDPATRNDADASPVKARSIDVWLLGIVTAALFGYLMPFALGDSPMWGGISALGLLVAALSLASTMGTIGAWQAGVDGDVVVSEAHSAPEADKNLVSEEAVSPAAELEPVAASAE